ncbi:MAG: creatininase family protein [Thermomicrobiales bacterium]
MPQRPTEPEVRLERLTGTILEDDRFDKAILPVGATEYHGPHLPYGTDTVTAETIAEAFARELGGTLVLPPIAVGVSHHHLPWKWTLSVRPDTLTLIIRDIAESLLHNGIDKLIVLTAHDGNPGPAEAAARLVSQEHGMKVALFRGWQETSARLLAPEWDIDGDHAGQSELSMVLYAAPETARPDLATAQPEQFTDLPLELIDTFDGTVPLGYSGDATKASAEQGEAIVKALVEHAVPYIKELDARGWKRGTWMSRIE